MTKQEAASCNDRVLPIEIGFHYAEVKNLEGKAMFRILLLLVTHGVVFAVGFGAGVYFLPILTAPPSIDESVLTQSAAEALYKTEFKRGQRGNDLAHWGEGTLSVSANQIVHQGRLAPGPDYKLYLVKSFAEHEDEFEPLKADSIQIADIKNFDGFIVDVPEGVNIEDYNTVLIWCEAFSEFITSAQYKS